MDEVKPPRWVLTLVYLFVVGKRSLEGTDKIKLVFYEPQRKRVGVLTRALAFSIYILAFAKVCTMLIPLIK